MQNESTTDASLPELTRSPITPTPAVPNPPEQGTMHLPVTRPLVTYALIAVNVAIFAAILVIQQNIDPGTPNPILDFGVIDFQSILHGEWYRLFTALFIHLSLAHIFFNAYALYLFGRTVESLFGHARFTLIYFFGGLCGSLASFVIGRTDSAGASGAIFAVMAAEMVFLYRHRQMLGDNAGRALRELLVLGGINLGLGLLSHVAPSAASSVIDNWGHIGGFIGGLIMATLIAPRFVIDQPRTSSAHIVDERPLSARWPLALVAVILLIAITALAIKTL